MPAVRHIREGNLFCSQAGRNTRAGMPGADTSDTGHGMPGHGMPGSGHGMPGSGHGMPGAGNGTPARAEPGRW